MGTRNLTAVQHNNEYKVAQYGQWDGYPGGQGMTILNFLRSADLNKFKEQLQKVQYLTKEKEEEIQKFLESIGSKDGWMNMEQNKKYQKAYPQLSRDRGAEILSIVYNNQEETLWINNSISFAGDSLFCEYAYVIDLDKNILEVYKGFNKEPVPQDSRFFGFEKRDGSDGYYPVKLWHTFNLDKLPTKEEFLIILDESEEDEEE